MYTQISLFVDMCHVGFGAQLLGLGPSLWLLLLRSCLGLGLVLVLCLVVDTREMSDDLLLLEGD